jgi:hypothetical protein
VKVDYRLASLASSVALGFAACGGDAFSSADPDEQPSGGQGHASAGSAGKADAGDPGAGGEPAATGGNGSGNSSGFSRGGSPTAGGADGAEAGGNGSAGEPPGTVDPVFTVSKLIDDMEDGNKALLDSNGDWYVFKDKSSGTIEPQAGMPFTMSALSPARDDSTQSVKITVSGFTGWGAACGFDFGYVNGVRQPHDLEDFQALRFWAKASKPTTVKLQMPTGDTDPLGGKCSGTGDTACFAHFTKSFSVGTDWREVTILFDDLKQEAAGLHVPAFDHHAVYSTFFVFGPNQSISIWIDDVALVR